MNVFPNPANGKTTISYSIAVKSNVSIELYNLVGEKVTTFLNENKASGSYSNELNLKDAGVNAGIYFLKLKVGNNQNSMRLVVF